MINGVREKRLCGKNCVIKIRRFPGVAVEDMEHNILILERSPCHLILHVKQATF